MKFVDANIFIRLLMRDDPAKAADCFQFFERVRRGDEEATTSATIIAEVFYVLTSPRLYHLSATNVCVLIRPTLELEHMRFDAKSTCLRAFDVLTDSPHLGFEDAYAVACIEAKEIDELLSYDRDFDRVPGVTRIEP